MFGLSKKIDWLVAVIEWQSLAKEIKREYGLDVEIEFNGFTDKTKEPMYTMCWEDICEFYRTARELKMFLYWFESGKDYANKSKATLKWTWKAKKD